VSFLSKFYSVRNLFFFFSFCVLFPLLRSGGGGSTPVRCARSSSLLFIFSFLAHSYLFFLCSPPHYFFFITDRPPSSASRRCADELRRVQRLLLSHFFSSLFSRFLDRLSFLRARLYHPFDNQFPLSSIDDFPRASWRRRTRAITPLTWGGSFIFFARSCTTSFLKLSPRPHLLSFLALA